MNNSSLHHHNVCKGTHSRTSNNLLHNCEVALKTENSAISECSSS